MATTVVNEDEMQQRALALDMAVRHHSGTVSCSAEVVTTAKDFYQFLADTLKKGDVSNG